MSDATQDAQRMLVSKARLEFLVDGVFAIAMTLLVLDLKVPELADRHSTSELAAGLRHLASGLVSYLLSFLMLGMFWGTHNTWFRHIERITKGVLVTQLFQMAVAAFFPFCAALFSRYPTNALSVVVYVGCAATYINASSLQWLLARRAGALAPPPDGLLYPRIQKGLLTGSLASGFFFVFYLVIGLTR